MTIRFTAVLRYLYVPINHRLLVRDAKSGKELRVSAPIEIVGRKLCAIGRWIETIGELHRVRFHCGREAWIPTELTQWYDEVVPQDAA